MSAIQQNKTKIRPVMNYRELNHSAHADVCGQKLQTWSRMGDNLTIIDLRKAYIQNRVHLFL
jgi:hypothetical protein